MNISLELQFSWQNSSVNYFWTTNFNIYMCVCVCVYIYMYMYIYIGACNAVESFRNQNFI